MQTSDGQLAIIRLTNLQLSQSESLLSRLLRDQRERRLGEGLRDQERDGGRRRSWEGLSWCCSSSPIWLETEWEGEGLRRRISSNSSVTVWVFLPHCRFEVSPCSSSFRFLVRVLLRWNRAWRLERGGRGLGERDQDSVSEDGGRTVRVGTGMGWVRAIPCGPTGEDIVIFRPSQNLAFLFQSSKVWKQQLVALFSLRLAHNGHIPVMLAFCLFKKQGTHFKLKISSKSLTLHSVVWS